MARARRELNDLKKKRWKDDHLREIVLDSLAHVAAIRPDYFLRSMDVSFGQGSVHSVSCCDRIARVDGLVDESGGVKNLLSRVDFKAEQEYRRVVCPPRSVSSFPTGYAIDAERPNIVHFSTPIPPGEKRVVRIWCNSAPQVSAANDKITVPSEAILDIQRMAVSIANGTETDSALAQSVSVNNEARVYRTAATRREMGEKLAKKGP